MDPKLLATYEKLGIPLHERARLAGVAVDAVFDSVSVATTFKEKLGKAGVIFCSFSDAVRNHPRTGRTLPRHGRADRRQFFRGPEFRGVLGRLFRLCAARGPLPIVGMQPGITAKQLNSRLHGNLRRGVCTQQTERKRKRDRCRRNAFWDYMIPRHS